MYPPWYLNILRQDTGRIINPVGNYIDALIIALSSTVRIDYNLQQNRDTAYLESAVFFIDPPYTAGGEKAGRRLYKHYDIDHDNLFKICDEIKGDFPITYDDADEVKSLARLHGFQTRLVPMTNTHHSLINELVIGKNLSWMDL